MLQLYDTATARVEPFELRRQGQVSMYVCGPTVYDLPHLGHGRYALVFDVLRRYLLYRGLEVDFVSNITDIDDKIIDRARQDGASPGEIARRYEAEWWRAMDALGVLRPTETPHATDYVPEMVALIGVLIDRGLAYQIPEGVYLSTEDVPGYGLLAGQSLDSLRVGARVAASEEKRSPLDFALWKAAKAGEPSWDSPWGPGRPGWHTECVVMSLGLLGEGFDLHGGGRDLAFPHHENERAQAVALGRAFARHWVHNGWVEVDGEKMSKSLGNFTSLSDMVTTSDPRAYRLLVLRAHYRRPMEVTGETVAEAERALERLDTLAWRFGLEAAPDPVLGPATDVDDAAVAPFVARLDDDLDTPGALAEVFDLVRQAHAAADRGAPDRAATLARTVVHLTGVLGLAVRAGRPEALDPAAAALVAARDEARARRDWARADALRDELVGLGWKVEDGAQGTVVRR